jgi:abortive infection alpha-like protein
MALRCGGAVGVGRWCNCAVGERDELARLARGGEVVRDGQGDDDRGVVEDAIVGAGRAAGWLFRAGLSVTKRLPGAEIAARQLRKLEDTAINEVRKRLDGIDGATGWPTPEDGDEAVEFQAAFDNDPLRAAMATLLNRSVSETRREAENHLFVGIMRQLTPDEARIVAALSDGTAYPLVHVAGRGRHIILRNASTVGKAAGVTLPELTPLYVSRLLDAGVAVIGDEDPSLATQYDILLTEDYVRAAEQQAKRPKHLRHTLKVSPFGDRFWRACDPSIQQLPRGDQR